MSRERSAEGREMSKPSRSPPIAASRIGLIKKQSRRSTGGSIWKGIT